MKIGVMQGRLFPPVDGHIQEFPHNDWEKEFDYIKDLGLIGIEWLVTKRSFPSNPVFDPRVRDQYPIISICLDVLVDKRIYDAKFLTHTISLACISKANKFTIPILDDSDMKDANERDRFCRTMYDMGNKFSNVNFSFEAELEKEQLNEIVSLHDNFKVTYDTGNATACGFDHQEYIEYFQDKIDNVHLKDRKFKSVSVEPFTGDTDFDTIFETLKGVGYNGTYVIQTARSGIPTSQNLYPEIETIARHKKLFENYDV